MVKRMVKEMVDLTSYKRLSRALVLLGAMVGATGVLAQNWTPSEISTELWLDAADLSTIDDSTVAGRVDQVTNKSDAANPMTQSNAAKKFYTGTHDINGLNALYSDGTSQMGLIFNTIEIMGKESHMVFSAADTNGFTGFGGGGNHQSMSVVSGGQMRNWSNGNTWTPADRKPTTFPTIQTNTPYVGGWINDPASKSFMLNGQFEGGRGTEVVGQNSHSANIIGFQRYATAEGKFGEIILTSGLLSMSDRAKLHGYLAHKWGLEASLPSDHPYLLNTPLTSAGAVVKINAAAVANDASGITLADIASLDGLSFTPIAANLSTYQTVIANASGFADAAAIDAAFKQPMLITVNTSSLTTVYGTANENQALTLTAPTGATFVSVSFSSYGTPIGSDGNFSIGTCHADNSQSVAESALIGNSGSITVNASNGTFGDPCGGVLKRLSISAVYSDSQQPVDIPLFGTVSGVTIDWGDGNTSPTISTAGTNSHTYGSAGNYVIEIDGSFTGYGWQGAVPTAANVAAITGVTQWNLVGGAPTLTSLWGAFRDHANLMVVPDTLPSTVTSLKSTFYDAPKFNQDLSSWDVSGVSAADSMQDMFLASRLSVDNYDRLIANWNSGQTLSSRDFHGGHSVFCATDPGVPDGGQNCGPQIVRVTLADDHSTITVTWSKPVFTNSDGTGALTVDDYVLAITGSGASLAATPTSISQNGNSYTLGLGLTGTLNSDQVISVLPAP